MFVDNRPNKPFTEWFKLLGFFCSKMENKMSLLSTEKVELLKSALALLYLSSWSNMQGQKQPGDTNGASSEAFWD